MAMPISFILQQQDQEESSSPCVPSISSSTCYIHGCSRHSWPIIYITSFAGVCSCQFERDSWCDGCYLLFGSYSGSPGSEVGSVSLHATADYDSPGFSSCFGSERGAHHSSSIIGRFGSSSSCYRPTTTTAVRWLGFFYIFV